MDGDADDADADGECQPSDHLLPRARDTHPQDTEAPKVAEGAGSGSDGVERCGSCYGAGEPGQCCTSCEEVRELYAKKGWAFKPSQMEQCQKEGFVRTVTSETAEGCRISGQLEVPRVSSYQLLCCLFLMIVC